MMKKECYYCNKGIKHLQKRGRSMNSRLDKLSYCKALAVIQFLLPLPVILHILKLIAVPTDILIVILGLESFLALLILLFVCMSSQAGHLEQGRKRTQETEGQTAIERRLSHVDLVNAEHSGQEESYRYNTPGASGTRFYSLDVDVDESLPKKVLIVDDSITTLKLLSAFLKKMNIGASMAKSGEEAIEAVQRERYALILMDHMMKGRDGLNTVKEIRRLKDDYYRQVPIVDVLSIGMEQQDIVLDQEYYQAYLIKPIDYEMLAQVMITYGLYSEE